MEVNIIVVLTVGGKNFFTIIFATKLVHLKINLPTTSQTLVSFAINHVLFVLGINKINALNAMKAFICSKLVVFSNVQNFIMRMIY